MHTRAITLLLLASLVVGLAQIALLPPFEGFDETPHYSYIQELAEHGRWPTRGERMSKDIDDYMAVAPTSDAMHGMGYFRFFASGAIEEGRRAIKEPPQRPRAAVQGIHDNWQSQHPPLYYALLVPAYLVSKDWSLGAHLFLLRTVSYLFAWGGLFIAIIGMVRIGAGAVGTLSALAVAAWPLLFPMWFPEMARMGNDSLLTVFAACALLLAASAASRASYKQYALLGVAIGLGLTTKIIYLPYAAAVFVVLGLHALFASGDPQVRLRRVSCVALAGVVVVAASGWWYVLKLVQTGAISGSEVAVVMNDAGGMIEGLRRNLDASGLISIPLGYIWSFFWGGTWSFIRPPRFTYIPFVIMIAIMTCGAWRVLRRERLGVVDWLPIATLVLSLIALTYYSFVTLAIGHGTSSAWYLHAFAPVFAILLMRGVTGALESKWTARGLAALWFFPVAFMLVMTCVNLLYFAGCAEKLPGRHYFAIPAATHCLANPASVIERLDVIVYPRYGLALLAVGLVIAVAGLWQALRLFGARARGASPREPRLEPA